MADLNIEQVPGGVVLTDVGDFDPLKIFECGQCFRWNRAPDGSYRGVAFSRVATVREEAGRVFISGTPEDVDAIWRDYFDLDRDYAAIRQRLSVDAYMAEATAFGAGLRLLRQEPWEALCSFILSQCNNIPRIKSIIEAFCKCFGEPLAHDGHRYYAFPTVERTASLTVEDLQPIRSGFRAPALLSAARAVVDGTLDLLALQQQTPEAALAALKRLERVGDKVASCVMLFGLHMQDAFPVDTWMAKVLAEQYPQGLDPAIFSPYAGIAQQYMFYHRRCQGCGTAPR